MSVELRGGIALEDSRLAMLESGQEELFVAYGGWVRTPAGILFLVAETARAPEEFVSRDAEGLHWSPELTRQWTHRAEKSSLGVVVFHAHGGEGPIRLSPTDERTCGRMLEHFGSHLPDQAHGYVVLGTNSATGWFTLNGHRLPLTKMKTVTCPIRQWAPEPAANVHLGAEMARQVAAITELGQARLASATVAVVGIGGGGSDVADQLAHMGLGHLILCDPDLVKPVNLSRQRGAGPSNLGAAKVHVMAAAIRHTNPALRITLLEERFPDVISHAVLRDADVIVACVDSPSARHELNKFSRRFLVPLVDIGATIRRNELELESIVGHVARLLPDGACVECEGLSSPALRERERAGRDVPYFEGADILGAPQVISINGVLASFAATEVLRLIAGLTESRASVHWRYEALQGEIYAREPLTPGCDVCQLFALGDRSA